MPPRLLFNGLTTEIHNDVFGLERGSLGTWLRAAGPDLANVIPEVSHVAFESYVPDNAACTDMTVACNKDSACLSSCTTRRYPERVSQQTAVVTDEAFTDMESVCPTCNTPIWMLVRTAYESITPDLWKGRCGSPGA